MQGQASKQHRIQAASSARPRTRCHVFHHFHTSSHFNIHLNLDGSEGEGVAAKDEVARSRVHNLALVLDIRQQHGRRESHAGLHMAYSRSRRVA
jgi:hypothetical protein